MRRIFADLFSAINGRGTMARSRRQSGHSAYYLCSMRHRAVGHIEAPLGISTEVPFESTVPAARRSRRIHQKRSADRHDTCRGSLQAVTSAVLRRGTALLHAGLCRLAAPEVARTVVKTAAYHRVTDARVCFDNPAITPC